MIMTTIMMRVLVITKILTMVAWSAAATCDDDNNIDESYVDIIDAGHDTNDDNINSKTNHEYNSDGDE